MNFHPSSEWLEQFAAGSLSMGQALCVSVHVAQCAECRQAVAAMQVLGGVLLESAGAVPVADTLLDDVFAVIDARSQAQIAKPLVAESAERMMSAAAANANMPAQLRKLIPGGYDALTWSRLLPSMQLAVLDVGDDRCQISLQRVRPGGRIAMHDHQGTELTLVLSGGFSDETGAYQKGDFLVREPSQRHEPIAHRDQECICLAALTAPVRFTGPLMRWVNPFIRI